MNFDILYNYFDNDEFYYITLLTHKNQVISNDIKTKNFRNNNDLTKKYQNELIKLNKTYSLYFTPNVFNTDDFRRNTNNIKYLKGMIFDFDTGDTYNNCKKLISAFPNYYYILETTENKFQVLYKFDKVITDKELFLEYEKINLTLATYFKSDLTTYNTNHLFRVPTFINKKNDFTTRIRKQPKLEINFNKFKNFIETENIELITPLEKTTIKKDISNNSKTINKDFSFDFNNKLKTIDDKLYFQYLAIYKRNNNNRSNADIVYLKNRIKKGIEFDLIFKELMFIREETNITLNRTIEDYYNYYSHIYNS